MNRLPLPTPILPERIPEIRDSPDGGTIHQDLDPADQPDGALQLHRCRAPVTATKAVS